MAPFGDKNGMRTKPESIKYGSELPQYVGDFGGYSTAHRRAVKHLGKPPDKCHCGCRPGISVLGRRLMELSYTGPYTNPRDKRGPYDPRGIQYIWECRSCNQQRRRGRISE
mgnify:FL=1